MSALKVSSSDNVKYVLVLALTLFMTTQRTDSLTEILAITYPGTNWCGPGNTSSSYEMLGRFDKTDECCRAHDECPDIIPPGAIKHGLKNSGLFTKSLCSCDDEFYTCLTDVGSPLSYKIRVIYFALPRSQCFKLEYPIITCTSYYEFIQETQRCKEYELDTTAPKIYQWFDLPLI